MVLDVKKVKDGKRFNDANIVKRKLEKPYQ